MKKLTAAIMASTIMLMNQNSAAAATPGTSADNPFFTEYTTTVLGTIPFSRVHNSDYEPAVDRGIKLQNQEIDAIVNNPDKPTFLNTIVALERSGADLNRVLSTFYPLLSADSDDELMEISMRLSSKLSDHSTSITLNQGLWKRIKSVYDNRASLNLNPEDEMLLQRTYDSFARSGAGLEGQQREEYRRLASKLSDLTTKFGQNVLKELNTYEIWLSGDELAGLPTSVLEAAALSAKEKGHDGEYRFTLAQPTYMAVMKYADSPAVRERFYRLYNSRNTKGEYSNMEIMSDIADTRRQIAALFGKETYAWDYSYWANKLKEAKYKYDEEALRPYFELNNVIDGVFGLATRLYGVTFRQNPDIEVYHPDVRAFEVIDPEQKVMGVIYTDFYPRETKRPGAWMTNFREEYIDADGDTVLPHVSIVMNFTKPTDTKPSLLTPYEVETFLHEFGHALHGLFASTNYASLSGTNVYRDFVELPSQFNENYLTEKEFLDGFARHYQTGEPIPSELVEKIIDTSRFGAGYACLRQLAFGLTDMAWHTTTTHVDDPAELERRATESVAMFDEVEGCMFSPQFSHIFAGGYAAGYYSYKWAEVLDADAFSMFKRNGLFDKKTADSFRTNILMRGGTEHPMTLYKRFRGQEPTIDALLQRDGIQPEEQPSMPQPVPTKKD